MGRAYDSGMTYGEPVEVDAVVVGAGISGLVAARDLHRAGVTVCVLEARDRVGGKMHTVSLEGCAVDLGAHWVGPSQRRVHALLSELDIETEPQHLAGRHSLMFGSRRRLFTGSAPRISVVGTAETVLRVAAIELRRRRIAVEAPWASRRAADLDAVTLADWMAGVRSESARATFNLVARTVFGAEPSELSLLFFLWYVQTAGGFRQLTEFAGGAQDSRIVGGAQQVCDRLAAELGGAVVLGSPVTSVTRRAGRETIVVAGGRRIVTRHVIFAVAPTLLDAIAFDPPLSQARRELIEAVSLGAYMKGVAVYDRAWWRERGLSGLAYADSGPVQMVVDDSPASGAPGVLVAFVTGASARELQRLSGAERRDAVLAGISHALADDAPAPSAYVDMNWLDEQWSRGAPVTLMPPNRLRELGPTLRAPEDGVHWAGTDTATEWNGYVEGALQSGARAAAEVLRALDGAG